MSLTLDGEGRYIQGIDCGKVAMLLEAGAKRIKVPRRFPPRAGWQYVAVAIDDTHDAALWIQDEQDFQRCRDETDRLTVWLEMKTAALVNAERLPPEQKVSDYDDRAFTDMW